MREEKLEIFSIFDASADDNDFAESDIGSSMPSGTDGKPASEKFKPMIKR